MIPNNYFLYWSGQDFQYVHYICVYSALKINNVDKIHIYYEEKPNNNPYWNELHNLDNVELKKINYRSLLKKTPFGKKDFKHFFSKAKRNHISDFFRYLILYCYGGIYLDFDIICIKELQPLQYTDFFVGSQHVNHEDGFHINGAIMGALKNSRILELCLSNIIEISKNKTDLEWADVGPQLVTEVLGMTHEVSFKVYPTSYFYHYPWFEWENIFEDNPIPDDAYLIHYWGKCSQNITREIIPETADDNPTVYNKCLMSITS